MSYILTCGCKSQYGGFPSEWDGETRECEPCVNFGSLCEKHFMEYAARPAQFEHPHKELSDEEIEKISEKFWFGDWDFNCFDSINFARAIIKASRGEE